MIAEKELTTKHYKKLVDVLGERYINENVESAFDFIHIARDGINATVLTNFIVYFNLSKGLTAQILNISEPTLYRWTKSNKTLDRNFSIKLFEIADLFLYGEEVFGNRDNFFKWLKLPNTALGGLEPQELIEIPGGVPKVKDILGRIEYGVYS
jgi:putative toxin-antitoxin system antitoxin component (TIGR02293 family)